MGVKVSTEESPFVKRKFDLDRKGIDLDQSLFTFSKNRVVFLLIALDFFVKIWYNLLKF